MPEQVCTKASVSVANSSNVFGHTSVVADVAVDLAAAAAKQEAGAFNGVSYAASSAHVGGHPNCKPRTTGTCEISSPICVSVHREVARTVCGTGPTYTWSSGRIMPSDLDYVHVPGVRKYNNGATFSPRIKPIMFIQTGTWLGYQSDVKKVDTLSGKGAWNDLVEKGKIGEGVARALHTTFLVKVVATFSPAINSKYVESKTKHLLSLLHSIQLWWLYFGRIFGIACLNFVTPTTQYCPLLTKYLPCTTKFSSVLTEPFISQSDSCTKNIPDWVLQVA